MYGYNCFPVTKTRKESLKKLKWLVRLVTGFPKFMRIDELETYTQMNKLQDIVEEHRIGQINHLRETRSGIAILRKLGHAWLDLTTSRPYFRNGTPTFSNFKYIDPTQK